MGLILDSSVSIAAERKCQNARHALAGIALNAAGEDIAVSVITLIELAHGVARANTPERKATRRQFLDELITALPVHQVTVTVALRAGQIDGENTTKGIRLPLSDLLIGVTALELGYRVASANVRHFQMIPGLGIVSRERRDRVAFTDQPREKGGPSFLGGRVAGPAHLGTGEGRLTLHCGRIHDRSTSQRMKGQSIRRPPLTSGPFNRFFTLYFSLFTTRLSPPPVIAGTGPGAESGTYSI